MYFTSIEGGDIVTANGEFGGMRTMDILLVADHTLFRDGIKLLLKKSKLLSHCEEAGELNEALDILKSKTFDLILLDIKLKDAIGLDSLRGIKKSTPTTPIITISDEADFHLATQAVSFGASAYISKAASYTELLQAIARVSLGEVYFSSEISTSDEQSYNPRKTASGISILSSLSDRQKEVLKHIAKGASNKGISVEMNISQNTVKAHLATIFKILGVHNRTEAFYFAARAGMPLD